MVHEQHQWAPGLWWGRIRTSLEVYLLGLIGFAVLLWAQHAELLAALLLLGLLLGLLLLTQRRSSRVHTPSQPLLVLLLLLLPLGVLVVSGGAGSAFWPVLLLPAIMLPLLLPAVRAGLLLGLLLASYAALFLLLPAALLPGALATWALHTLPLALIAYLCWQVRQLAQLWQHDLERSDANIQRVLQASERLRASMGLHELVEELVSAAKAIGPFSAASFSTLDSRSSTLRVRVVLGQSGRILGAVEGLTLSWGEVAPLLCEERRVGQQAFLTDQLPFRSARGECHLLISLYSQAGELLGLLTISAEGLVGRRRLLQEVPALELLTTQAALALENLRLYALLLPPGEHDAASRPLTTTQVQRALQTQQAQLRRYLAVVATLDEGVIVGDQDGCVQLVNPAAEALLGLRAEEVLGRPLAVLPGGEAVVSPAPPGSQDEEQQFQLQGRTICAHAAAVKAANGEPLGCVMVYHDLSLAHQQRHAGRQ